MPTYVRRIIPIQKFRIAVYFLVREHRYGFTLVAFLLAALITGSVCVVFMRAFEFVFKRQLDFQRVGFWCFLSAPLLFSRRWN